MSAARLRDLRGGEIGFVFQDPMTSLNPVFTVGFQLMEPIRRAHRASRKARGAQPARRSCWRWSASPTRASRLDDYPHQFSGGMRQRVMIAMALACDPKLLIADEPTTALDVTIQAQILEIVRELRQQLGMAIIWITHDLGVVAGIADRVMVMYAGQVVEQAPVARALRQPAAPLHPRAARDDPERRPARARGGCRTIEGQPPILMAEPRSCPFAPRCRACLRPLPRRRTRRDCRSAPAHDVACWWDAATGDAAPCRLSPLAAGHAALEDALPDLQRRLAAAGRRR